MTNPEVVDVFKRLEELMKHGVFRKEDVLFMERFLEEMLKATQRLRARMEDSAHG